MVSHLIPPTRCASCRLCCNFRRCSAWETPSLSPELAAHLRSCGVPLTHRPDGSTSFTLQFPSNAPEDFAALCPVLDPHSGCTLPREMRPTECRLWPLRLMRTPGGPLCLGLYDACPALSPEVRAQLIREATGPMLLTLLDLAHNQPYIVRPTDPGYSIVWREDNEEKEEEKWEENGGENKVPGEERGKENNRRRQGKCQVRGTKYEVEIRRNSVAQGGGGKAG